MPPTTRRSARIQSSRSPSQHQQQQKTLNFRSAGKVTKPAVVIYQGKSTKTGDAVATTFTDTHEGTLQQDELEGVGAEEVKGRDAEAENIKAGKEEQEKLVEVKVEETREEEENEEGEEEGKIESQIDSRTPHDIFLAVGEAEENEMGTVDSPLTTLVEPTVVERPLSIPSTPSSLADLPPVILKQLSEITAPKVSLYYKSILEARLTKPVHQNELSLSEKILRNFDESIQYLPRTGITRINRWKRAYHLGLNPPIEVLKVLVEVEQRGGKVESGKKAVGGEGVSAEAGRKRDERMAFIDEELSSRTAQE